MMKLTFLAATWRRVRRPAGTSFAHADAGGTAIEFALVAPLYLFLLAATVDFGLLLTTRFSLNEAVSSSTAYALANANKATSQNAGRLASDLVTLIPEEASTNVVVNKGAGVTRSTAARQSSGTAAEADQCYCPTIGSSAIQWGTAKACYASCPNGGYAGKFVSITATRPYKPLFAMFGLLPDGAIVATAVVQIQ